MPIVDLVLLCLLVVGLFTVLVVIYRKDRRYLKSKTSETMSASVRQELEQERIKALQRKKKFEEALRR